MTEPADYKYYKNVQTAQELILRTGNKKFNDITILLEHTEKAGSIPKSNPHLLHAELKNKIPRHDNITHMYFTRSGKIKISTSDPVCAVQITAIDQILNTPVKANIIWEGFTSRFLLFDIPTTVHLADVAIELKNSNDLDIVEIRRFIKPNSRQKASPVLITILEALAICQAIDDLAVSNKNLLILSDSLSVLYALQNYSIKSHSVIHRLASKIYIQSKWSTTADVLRAQVTSRNEIKNALEDLIEVNTQTPDTLYHPDEAQKPRLPDPIVQPIAVMPLSRT
ncbi:putative RNA-directed DNA polymerase from transposon X-element [Trichonephila clavipes]|nr:putative RNA-directed DNA polymerase from transposon X-element [Trichonephila clavipes]